MNNRTTLAIAALAVATCFPNFASSATAIDYSDQWGIPGESGWGAAIVQQADMLSVDLLVYGTDGRPAWYVAWAPLKPSAMPEHTVFSGDLYATTGPWFGGPFDPALVTERKVGTLTFDASAASSATIAYSVDGVAVSKNVTRLVWGRENLSGRYAAIWNFECPWGLQPLWGWRFTETTIAHSTDGLVRMQIDIWGTFEQIELLGTYRQDGRLGEIKAHATVPPGQEMITISNIEPTGAGFTARLSVALPYPLACNAAAGRIVAVRTQ